VFDLLFDLSTYLYFLVALAIVYIAAVNFTQSRIGGKGRFAALQKEMRDVQLKMMEASKKGDTKESNDVMNQYWKLTGELFTLQMQMTAVILVIFVGLMALFPHIEPGMEDDTTLALFDDGLAAHCDAAASDYVFSNCLPLPSNGTRGAWVVDAYLKSQSNETLARNATAVYFEGGQPTDVWLQGTSQTGFIDIISGKRQYHVVASTDLGENHTYRAGDVVSIHAYAYDVATFPSEKSFESDLSSYNSQNQRKLQLNYSALAAVSREAANPNGTKITGEDGTTYLVHKRDDGAFYMDVPTLPSNAALEAVSDSGTFFYIDLPFTIPLLNIRRIIGSYGVFIFTAFVVSIAFAIGKSVYSSVKKIAVK
jgi:hypothetical protein